MCLYSHVNVHKCSCWIFTKGTSKTRFALETKYMAEILVKNFFMVHFNSSVGGEEFCQGRVGAWFFFYFEMKCSLVVASRRRRFRFSYFMLLLICVWKIQISYKLRLKPLWPNFYSVVNFFHRFWSLSFRKAILSWFHIRTYVYMYIVDLV